MNCVKSHYPTVYNAQTHSPVNTVTLGTTYHHQAHASCAATNSLDVHYALHQYAYNVNLGTYWTVSPTHASCVTSTFLDAHFV